MAANTDGRRADSTSARQAGSSGGRGAGEVDVIIVGAGIAGASAAYEVAAFASVVVSEQEAHVGYHSTGRSAASFTENYGTALIRRLAIASRCFLEAPPPDFSDHPLLSPRGIVTIARADQLDLLARDLARARELVPTITPIGVAEAIARVPIIRTGYLAGAFLEPDARDIDVDGLHQGYLRGAKARGARIAVNVAVEAIETHAGRWRVSTSSGSFTAPIVVNAAGSWADAVAAMAGIEPLGLVPKRRTVFTVALPPGMDARRWPMVDDIGGELYFKPDAAQLLVSPADATPSPPMDAFPEDLDIAVGVERLERATTLTVSRVARSWAGLRTLATDAAPVVGLDATASGFFWLAGQGGYGIKTSPALSRACASLIRCARIPEDLDRLGVTAAELSPDRLRRRP